MEELDIMIDYDLVSVECQKQAMAELGRRIRLGEDPATILGIRDTYYLEKVVAGLMGISYILYARIMRCDLD